MANPMADEMRRFRGSDEKNPFERRVKNRQQIPVPMHLTNCQNNSILASRTPSKGIFIWRNGHYMAGSSSLSASAFNFRILSYKKE